MCYDHDGLRSQQHSRAGDQIKFPGGLFKNEIIIFILLLDYYLLFTCIYYAFYTFAGYPGQILIFNRIYIIVNKYRAVVGNDPGN